MVIWKKILTTTALLFGNVKCLLFLIEFKGDFTFEQVSFRHSHCIKIRTKTMIQRISIAKWKTCEGSARDCLQWIWNHYRLVFDSCGYAYFKNQMVSRATYAPNAIKKNLAVIRHWRKRQGGHHHNQGMLNSVAEIDDFLCGIVKEFRNKLCMVLPIQSLFLNSYLLTAYALRFHSQKSWIGIELQCNDVPTSLVFFTTQNKRFFCLLSVLSIPKYIKISSAV